MSGTIHISDSNYPKLLKKIKDPPKTLYYKGKLDPQIFRNCLAVVGSRKMTDYGQEMVEKFVSVIARAGVTIVSGFMYGIDAAAHQVCLENSGRTIAVLGCGIDLVRPVVNKDLYDKILENNGLILSEYEGKYPAFRWTFVRRNRIVSGLSKAVLVVEASEESGALITADFAKKQGRKVFSIPGALTSTVSQGTARLIKDGAKLVTSPREILAELGLKLLVKKEKGTNKTGSALASKKEKQILDLLAEKRLTIDEISRTLGIPASEIGTSLSFMLLKGWLKEDSQGKYRQC